MPTIMISIMPDGIPVDKMDEDDNGSSCPIATRDEEVNDVNKMYAQDKANYHDATEDGGFKLSECCGNCSAYNQTEDMMDCIGDESGDSGYCQIYKFVCSSDYVCNEWVKGGPITGDAEGSERDIL
tara:strand:- start:45 stop:422 length:378 start_codon:yes stop_codon:yes gene_type:complete